MSLIPIIILLITIGIVGPRIVRPLSDLLQLEALHAYQIHGIVSGIALAGVLAGVAGIATGDSLDFSPFSLLLAGATFIVFATLSLRGYCKTEK